MDLLCFDHLTEGDRDVPAVTVAEGFAVCRDCATSRADNREAIARAAEEMQREVEARAQEALDRIGGFGTGRIGH
jgi:hypothetical protein